MNIGSFSTSGTDSVAAAATQSLEEESSPGTNDPGLFICESSSRPLDKVDSHIDIGCAEMYIDVEAGTNAGIGFPVSGSEFVYCCDENTIVAEIGQEEPSSDINDPGSATCMDEVDSCETGHYKGLVSSAYPNVNEHEVRQVAVIFNIYALVKPNLPLMTSYRRFS